MINLKNFYNTIKNFPPPEQRLLKSWVWDEIKNKKSGMTERTLAQYLKQFKKCQP